MFVQDAAPKSYLRVAARRRGWGRVILLAGGLLLLSARLAYGSGPERFDRVVVRPGDTVWSIAAAHYPGDPRPHVEAILRLNHLASPVLMPGQSLQVPAE